MLKIQNKWLSFLIKKRKVFHPVCRSHSHTRAQPCTIQQLEGKLLNGTSVLVIEEGKSSIDSLLLSRRSELIQGPPGDMLSALTFKPYHCLTQAYLRSGYRTLFPITFLSM